MHLCFNLAPVCQSCPAGPNYAQEQKTGSNCKRHRDDQTYVLVSGLDFSRRTLLNPLPQKSELM